MANDSMLEQKTPLTAREYATRTAIRAIAIIASVYGMAASWEGLMLSLIHI